MKLNVIKETSTSCIAEVLVRPEIKALWKKKKQSTVQINTVKQRNTYSNA